MIDPNLITTQKNLLAFSGGVDSSALFFILLENNIQFDICIIDYHQRKQSKEEVEFAKNLATKYQKECFSIDYVEEKFSEKSARDFRYKIFEEIISQHQYESLITAHQLNDTLEWFLMQLTKGAGLTELIGLETIEYRQNYILYRPLLEKTKQELLDYLQTNNHHYFIDSTNDDTKYKRNYFRHEFSDKLIDLYQDGITKSFQYLKNDLASLDLKIKPFVCHELSIYTLDTKDNNKTIRYIDKELKQRGVIISSKTREEILLQKEIVISHQFSIAITHNQIWISPFNETQMEKHFKEKCRIAKIPKKIRGYLFYLMSIGDLPDQIWKFGK